MQRRRREVEIERGQRAREIERQRDGEMKR